MWPISTVPFCTASSTCRPGTISPAAKVWIWNLLSVASADHLGHHLGAAVQRVERFRPARRHAPLDLRHRLRDRRRRQRRRARRADAGDLEKVSSLHGIHPCWLCRSAFVSRLAASMEHPVGDIHPRTGRKTQKSPVSQRDRAGSCDFRFRSAALDYPRVRERIMKVSKVYSATCHHRYWSER